MTPTPTAGPTKPAAGRSSTSSPAAPIDVAHAEEVLWAGLRLVVIDTETTSADRQTYAVAVAAVTCRRGLATGTWATLLNPGVPISARSSAIHGITGDHVAHEPTFGDIAEQLLDTLRPRDEHERVVFVAHNAPYDLGVLRAELARTPDSNGVLHDPLTLLPDLPVLDTSNGRLADLADLQPAGRSLADVLDALGLANTRAHDAASDAGATAQAAIALLNRAAARGHTNITDVLALVGAPTTHSAKTSTAIRRKDVAPRQLTLPHAASHGRLLPAAPTAEEWEQWRADVAECARYYCDRLDDRLRADQANPLEVLTHLEAEMGPAAEPNEDGEVDRAAVNTLAVGYGTVASLAPPLGRKWTGTAFDRIHALLGAVGRCSGSQLCAGCARTGECGHDSWWQPLVPHYLGAIPTWSHALNLFRPNHARHPGVVVTAARTRSHPFASYAIWLLVELHESHHRTNYALKVAETSVENGFHDPRLVDYLAAATAQGGRDADLAVALKLCRIAQGDRGNSTDAGWRILDARVALLLSQQARLATPVTGLVDDDGHPIPKRRHHPQNPTRTRPLRFARQQP